MLNAMLAWLARDAADESFEAKTKVRQELDKRFGNTAESDDAPLGSKVDRKTSSLPSIVYDERGKPRPADMAYDSNQSDVLPEADGLEDAATDDDNPFPGLYPPLG